MKVLTGTSFLLLVVAAVVVARLPVRASPSRVSGSEAGERIFEQRCALCHSTTDRPAQGPGLGGVVGRKAGSARFGYSPALRASELTWDPATLDQFLTNPPQLVPGTAMPTSIPDAAERGAVIDYLATLTAEGLSLATGAIRPAPSAPAPPGLRSGAAGFGDYRSDGPGVRRHFTVSDLPPPFQTPSVDNGPDVIVPATGALPAVPPGFRVDVFAHDLSEPRLIRVSPGGDLFVAESRMGRVRVLRAPDGARASERQEIFASDLNRPFGIAFYPPGPDPRWVYVAETNAIVRFAYRNGDMRARSAPETIVPRLTVTTGGHWTRDVGFSTDGKEMFVSVGSGSNVAEDGSDERDRADVLVFDPLGASRQVFASGIRNCVGLAIHPTTGDVWCSTNERDELGDNLVPDYVTRVRRGGFYGWPWYYLGDHEDPRHAGERSDLAGSIIVPDVLLQSHSAPLEMTFYGATAFPPEYQGAAFVALHGSWNRAVRTGPKVVEVPVQAGVPTGEYEDFMTGLVATDDAVWARPVGVAVAHDGSLFVSEDANGTIWRITYSR